MNQDAEQIPFLPDDQKARQREPEVAGRVRPVEGDVSLSRQAGTFGNRNPTVVRLRDVSAGAVCRPADALLLGTIEVERRGISSAIPLASDAAHASHRRARAGDVHLPVVE